mmetsp:Transcript_25301/g.36710  ORF Transcript_25301/g.36710 Transcript_25301/m.36710 type:complete len:615 (+) Transcript_25301:114-1958(+)
MFSSFKKKVVSDAAQVIKQPCAMDTDSTIKLNQESLGEGSERPPTAPSVNQLHDEPEVDYDEGGPTELYRRIENKDWDGAILRAETHKSEAKTWVSRREVDNRSKVRWRLLPIHATCVFRSPLGLIECLIKSYPDGPQMKDDQGMLPVHLACRNGASKGVVTTLLSAFPESIDVKDRKGRVPMQLVEASQSQNREAVIMAMKKFKADMDSRVNRTASSFPRSVSSATEMLTANEVDYEHRTVLFRLVLKKDWTGAISRSSSFPEEASTWIVTKGFNGNLRFLPLHKACVLQPHETVVESLIASYPEGAKSRDQDGWLPLHCACFYGAAHSVVDALLVAHPKGSQSKDDEGRLPLHYACLKGAPEGVVSSLLNSFAKGAMSKDDEGRLPVHHACSKGAPDGVIEALLKSSPKGAQSKDDQGRLPLHHACRKGASERVVKALLRVYPRGAQVKDDQDKLPIHYACQNGASEIVINGLLTTFPESINVKNGFGYTPLAEARALDNPRMDPIIAILERFKAEQDRIKAENGALDEAGGASAAKIANLESTVEKLTGKVSQLESIIMGLSKVGQKAASSMKSGKKGESENALKQFAEALGALEIRASNGHGPEVNVDQQ